MMPSVYMMREVMDMCVVYMTSQGDRRRLAGRVIRNYVRKNPEAMDLIPDMVWVDVYRVRAVP